MQMMLKNDALRRRLSEHAGQAAIDRCEKDL